MALPEPRTLPEALGRQAALHPSRIALRTATLALTYADLARQADAAAHRLQSWGVRAGDRVAWLGLNDPAQVVLLFALARLGAALLPLNHRLAPAEWQALLAQTQPRLLVHADGLADSAAGLASRQSIAVHAATSLTAAGEGAAPPDAAHADAAALLVQTSGTTGLPRAAVHTQGQLLANMRIAAQVQMLTPDDVVLTVLPLFHVGGLCIQTLPALSVGATVLLHPRFMPEATFDAIADERPSLTLQVPATLKALVEHPRWATADLACLRAVWAGSSLLPAPLLGAFHARGVPLCNVYGATESGPFSIALGPRHAMDHVGSCGWPAPGVEVRLEAAGGAGADGAGEVWLRGPNVVRKYWPDQPAVGAEGWFHTGDLAMRAADGSYTIVGRCRDLVISGGENIHPAEIEAALALHPGVLECAAFGIPDPRWGEAVAVAVVLRPGMQPEEGLLRDHLAARIARYKLPRRWVFVQQLPKTALGKVQRAALAALAGDAP
ncbi:MAG: class I adenylate-forming enzyme family protein [Ramlibacter sp.]